MRQQGFTLIEMIVYIGILASLGTVLTLFGAHIMRQGTHTQQTAVLLGNARGTLEDIAREARHATAVYTPTSAFGVHPGQLSLVTKQNLPTDEKETYVDFYVDDERLYRKREAATAQLITSEQIRITNFVVTHLNTSGDSALRIEMTVVPVGAGTIATAQSSVTLFTTVSLRIL